MKAPDSICTEVSGIKRLTYMATVAVCMLVMPAFAADWSSTELQFQYGELDAPVFAGGASATTNIFTLSHASGWKYGDTFFFIDYLNDDNQDGFNDQDLYGELYLNFSLGKILDRQITWWRIKDVGVVAGLNMGADANVHKYLPGFRLSWDVPGFAFLNTDFTAYIDDNEGVASGGAPRQDDSFHIDMSWAYPLPVAEHLFSISGHIEYIGERSDELGNDVSWHVLGQPQFRYDLGDTLFADPGRLFVGVEWQFWINKLGDEQTDENAVQMLVVWRL